MLHTFIPAAETYRNSTRPGIYDSLKRVLRFYSLESTAQIFFNGENEIAKLVGSNATDKPRTGIYTDGMFRNKLYITAEVDPHPFNSGYSSSHRSYSERSVFRNDEVPFVLMPVFEGREINVEITMHFNSRQKAEEAVNSIRFQQTKQMADFMFSAHIHLPVNTPIIQLMEWVHNKLKENDPKTPDIGDWMDKYSSSPLCMVSNAAGNNPIIVVPMRLDGIGIQFKDPTVKKAMKAQLTGSYEVTIPYMFYWQEFTGWELEYPLNVYQEQIPEEFIPRVQETFVQQWNKRISPEMAMGQQLNTYSRLNQTPFYMKLPEHDPWTMPGRRWITPMIQARLAVEDKPVQEFGNMFDLKEFQWNDLVKRYMIHRGNKTFLDHYTPFLIECYSNDLRVDPTQLRLDDKGMVSLSRAPTMKNTYRLLATLDYAIKDLNDDFWQDLWDNPEFIWILPGIWPQYPWNIDPNNPRDSINDRGKIIDNLNFGDNEYTPPWCNLMSYLGLVAHNEANKDGVFY